MVVTTINGNNYDNNNVIVDFTTKTVKFEPVIHRNRTFYYFLNATILGSYVSFFITAFIIMIGLFSWIDGYPIRYLFRTLVFLSLCSIMIVYAMSYLIYLPIFVDSWNKYYPQFNATMIYFCRILTGTFPITTELINCQMLKGNVWILPRFSNVSLKYKLVGDFATNIEKIEIHNHIITESLFPTLDKIQDFLVQKILRRIPRRDVYPRLSDGRFYAVFSFKNKIKQGYMQISYL